MAALRQIELWRQLRSWRFALLAVAVALALLRSRDQPHVDLGFGATTASIGPGDIALVALAAVALAATLRRGLPREARWIAVATIALAALVLATAARNGSAALVSGAKLVELGALTLGVVALVRTRARLEALVDVLIGFTIAADLVGLFEFVQGGGGRQASFLGEHDFAALATLPLVYGLALLHDRTASGRRAAVAIVAGAIGVTLGAALASLVGLYLGAAALLGAAAFRRSVALRPAFLTLAVVAAVSAGTLTLRAGELGFLQSWFGKPPERPGQYASSWSQRLIYAYVGGRVFVDQPVLGTGWWGELPPREFVRYLPDARRRFSDQPRRYFPPPDHFFVPQQAFDQVLYELGLVGVALLTGVFAAVVVSCISAARRSAGALGLLPAVWTAATIGALAGEGLFGGTPLAATFWLTLGLVPALAAIARVEQASRT